MNTRLVVTVLFVAAVAVNTATAQTTTAATTLTPSLTADVLNVSDLEKLKYSIVENGRLK